MIKRLIAATIILMTGAFIMTGCNESKDTNTNNVEAVTEAENPYEQITQEEAKSLMDSEENYIILDVRTVEEFNET
ncbi:MAG: hypothetical protein IKJ87_06135, partial [Ruminococcus sp.]|nr:hypothetical protein [Ruminococcus sp.]